MICHLFSFQFLFIIIMKAAAPTQLNLITQQKALLKKIYNQGENLWKILIFDNFNNKINSSLFKMKDLRENNITLYFPLKETREQLHGVTAIYLVQPIPENFELILKDFEEDLYSSVVLHFSQEPQSQILSKFAKDLAKLKTSGVSKVSKVEYSCLGFNTISRNLAVAHDNNALINLITIMKHKPIFVYGQKDQQQVQLIRDRLANSPAFSKEQELISLKQPHNIVLFFNRELDYFPVLSHGISYSGLIESLYKLTPNGQRIIKKGDKSLDIDLNDDIWIDRRNLPISQMELSEQFNKLKIKMMSDKQKMDEYTENAERSKKIEIHIHTAEQLIKEASSRQLKQYNDVEMDIYRKRVLSNELKKEVMVLLQSSPNEEDKVRLVVIILICCEHIYAKEIEEFEEKVPSLKKCKLFNEYKNKLTRNSAEEQGNMVVGSSKLLKKFAIGIMSNFKSGDKFLVTKYVEKIRQLKEAELREIGLNISSLNEIPADVKIANILVYCLGGACLSEEANLSKFDNRVIYSGDKMINYSDLL